MTASPSPSNGAGSRLARGLRAMLDQGSQLNLFGMFGAAAAAPEARPDRVAPTAGPVVAAPFYLDEDRALPASWRGRARDNLYAIELSAEIVASGRSATRVEQERLIRFTGFGASDLANGAFRRPGESRYRAGWEEIGAELEALTSPEEHAALAQSTQYAHFTPEGIVRAIWAALTRFGFAGGRVLEPGIGTGLFPALMPAHLRGNLQILGIEADPITARIATLLRPDAEIRAEDFATTRLRGGFALAIGNPPYSTRVVRTDPAYRALGLRLHDYFICKAVDALAPGGFAAFVTSQGTMDKAETGVRARLAERCDLLGAIRLPEGAFSATAGTEVGTDILFLRRRRAGEGASDVAWIETESANIARAEHIEINRYFIDNPDMVLGAHVVASGPFGPAYACRPIPGLDLDAGLARAVAGLPADLGAPDAEEEGEALAAEAVAVASGRNERLREGSFFVADDRLMQVIDGEAVAVAIKGKGTSLAGGIFPKHARIIRDLIPIRDSVRAILALQERREPSSEEQARLGDLYDAFVARHGWINATTVQVREADGEGARTETHRQPNLAPFRDDPDCWLVASIEDYDLESDSATRGLIFHGTVIAPEPPAEIRTAADALARCLHDTGHVDVDEIARLLGRTRAAALDELGPALFRDPETDQWETADAYLSGKVRDKLAAAIGAADLDPSFRRNVEALELVQPTDIPPSDITARLGQPWIPVDVIERFLADMIRVRSPVRHYPEAATWTVNEYAFAYCPEADLRWGTHRYGVGKLVLDALNARTPQIFDTAFVDGRETRELNVKETEAAKEKLQNLKGAFESWVWRDPERADRLSRLYNDTFNNLVARRFDGSHLTLPGSSASVSLRPHQKRAIWRMVAAGGTYLAHAVGAGKSWTIAGAIMEQRRLGLISKAIVAVPGHCLAQFAREFLHLYPRARILVADENNFARDKRRRFLARAATGDWDAIIITHSAFRFIGLPAAFERQMLEEMIDEHVALIATVDRSDRLTIKQLERKKEALRDRLKAIELRRDDFMTLGEIGIDQIYVDEAQEFRRLAFSTNQSNLKGIDSEGSQMAWDLFAKARYLRRRRSALGLDHGVDRALNLASGTPITNTIGEMFTLQRFMDPDGLAERALQEFDAWAASFGETRTELELQPSGRYKPVTRFAEFVNVPELISQFRAFADVVSAEDLRQLVQRPDIAGGKRRIITAPATEAFRGYQRHLDERIKAIEARSGRPKPGDDIILSVIGDGRHAAMDLRLVLPGHPDEPENKLNRLVAEVHRIHLAHAAQVYRQPDGSPYERPGASQMVFSDLGTLNAEARRGFSAYRWIKGRLVQLGVPASEIAFVQDFKGSQAKARLFADMRAGKVRIVIGSTKKMGTGVNAQNRMVALHHLDVPWLPSDIEQREGRIDRQGNQNPVIEILAYATEGSMDATMWQTNERKARFIAAALSGDRSIRRLEDVGEGSADQFAMAKAIASGDPRLMQKAGLEAEISRLVRLRDAHQDEQHSLRARVRTAERTIAENTAAAAAHRTDLARREPAGEGFSATVGGLTFTDRTEAGRVLLKALRDLEFKVANGRPGRDHRRDQDVAVVRGFTVHHWSALERLGKDKDVAVGEIEVMMSHRPISLRGSSVTPGAVLFDQIAEVIDGLDGRLSAAERRIEAAQAEIARVRPMIGRTFDLEGELVEKRARLAEITAALASDGAEQARAA